MLENLGPCRSITPSPGPPREAPQHPSPSAGGRDAPGRKGKHEAKPLQFTK